MIIPDNRKVPTIDKFGYFGKTQGFVKAAIKDNYFLYPENLEKNLCKTIQQGINSIDELIENNEKFL